MRALLIALLLLLGITALWGGWAFVREPDGSMVGAPLSLLEHTPFTDYFWPGVILGGLFGIGGTLSAALVLARWRWSLRMAEVIGAGQLIWICFQLFTMVGNSWLQLALLTIALTIIALAEVCRRSLSA